MVKDYYLTLEVDASADPAEIKSAYRRLAKKYHPDLNPSRDAHDRMKALTEAYGVLGDAAKRARYDRKRAAYSTAHPDGYDTPPPRKSRKAAYAEIKISEAQIADAIRLSKINLILTSTLLQRRLGLDYDHAAKLFNILIRRGFVDEDGRWTPKARDAATAKGPTKRRASEKKKSASPPPSADAKPNPRRQEFRINESLLSRALHISRTNYMLSVGVLKQRLGLDHARAARLYALLEKRGFIDENGVWTDAARTRAKSRTSPYATPPPPPPPASAKKRSGHAADVSEELVGRVIGLAHRPDTLSIAFLQRRFDLDYVRAARLFEILIKRGFIDRAGHWNETASHEKTAT